MYGTHQSPFASLHERDCRRNGCNQCGVILPLQQRGIPETELGAVGVETAPGDRQNVRGLVHVDLFVVLYRQRVPLHVSLHFCDRHAPQLCECQQEQENNNDTAASQRGRGRVQKQ